MAKLSIIIPVYNMNRQLNQCLLTIRRSVRLPYEVIIVDDGSSDNERVAVSVAGDDVRVLRSEEHHGFSHAVNMGIRASVGEVVLFLHADVLLAQHTAEDMLDVLISDPKTGAVCAVAPRTYEWEQYLPETDYHSLDAFEAVAEDVRARAGNKRFPMIIAELFALMVRRDVLERAGLLDEEYSVPALASYDYTIRMTRAGDGIAAIPSIYVHHNDSIHAQEMEEYDLLRQRERSLFYSKQGLSLDYSFYVRLDILPMADLTREGVRVLEIGCACGATLREIGARNPTALLYGVELNERAAAIAAPFAKILSMNVENLDPAEIPERFDYIIMGDVIEHLLDPWTAVRNMRELLVPGGSIIASIPNVAHITNLYNMLSGSWTYEDMGLLDRTHLRFFTKSEIVKMFEEADLVIDDIRPRSVTLGDSWEAFREEILSLHMIDVNPEDLDAYPWYVCARRV